MKHAQSSRRARLPRTFNELCVLHPLRPIADNVDFENAGEMIDQLAVLNNPTQDQADYLGTLSLLYEDYEDREHTEAGVEPRPEEMLKYLMDLQKLSQADVANILGIGQSAVSMILSGERGITAEHARRLGAHFKVAPGLFV